METKRNNRYNLLRPSVMAVILTLGGVVWVQPLAHLFRQLGQDGAPLAAGTISLSAILLGLLLAVIRPLQNLAAGGAAGILAALCATFLEPESWAAALSLSVLGLGMGKGARILHDRMPESLGKSLLKRPGIALLWIFLALVSIVQMGRLSTWVTDPEYDFVLTTRNPFWYKHLCLPAYLYGGELAARGDENVYAAEHYTATNREAKPESQIAGMAVEDPFQYPPQFLLLPVAVLQLSQDFAGLRIFWFAIQFSLFVGVFLSLALWIGGRGGRLALWCLPASLAAFPILFNFQFGQFHLPAVALAIAGMLAFQIGRRGTGGFLLASAILAKVFPLLLLPVLAVRQKFRALAWVAAWGVALTLLTLLLLGPKPFEAFLNYHLPRLQSGAAFAFEEAWPEAGDLVVVDNQGVFGLARKIGVSKPPAATVGSFFSLALLLGAAFFGFRFQDRSRWHAGVLWLSLLGLGSMASPGAWGDYVPSVAVWLLTLLLAVVAEDRRWTIPFVTVALFEGLLLGTMPIGDWAPLSVMLPASAVGSLLLLGLFVSTLVLAPRRSVRAEGEGMDQEEPGKLRSAA